MKHLTGRHPIEKHLWQFKWRRKLVKNSANTAKVDLSIQFSLFETSHKPTPYRKHLWQLKWIRKLVKNSANTAKVDLSIQFSLFETSHKPTPYRKHLWQFKWIRKLIRNSADTAKVDLSSQFSLFETSHKPTPYRKHLWEFKLVFKFISIYCKILMMNKTWIESDGKALIIWLSSSLQITKPNLKTKNNDIKVEILPWICRKVTFLLTFDNTSLLWRYLYVLT